MPPALLLAALESIAARPTPADVRWMPVSKGPLLKLGHYPAGLVG